MNRTQDRLLNRKYSTTELQQPAGKQTLQFCIYTVCLPAGCYSSVAECLCVKQAVLGSIPNGDQIFFNSVVQDFPGQLALAGPGQITINC